MLCGTTACLGVEGRSGRGWLAAPHTIPYPEASLGTGACEYLRARDVAGPWLGDEGWGFGWAPLVRLWLRAKRHFSSVATPVALRELT